MKQAKQLTEQVTRKRVMNVLIVDDRPENLLTLESIIEQDGRNVIKASSGNEALRLAIRENIGLILLDIQMPEIDGFEVARLLRSNSRTRHIPLIFVSAINDSEKPCLEEFEAGTVDCLTKPLNLEQTKVKVAQMENLFHMMMDKQDALKAVEMVTRQLEQFVYHISHDLKTPLRAIDNLANWIHSDLGSTGDPNIQENLMLLRSRVNRMNALLEGISEFARSGQIDEIPEAVNLSELAHIIFETIVPPAGFELSVDDLPTVYMERTRIYKIMYHLIGNAIVHHHQPENGRIRITCTKSGEVNVLRVEDNGPGIKPQYATRVFELLTTLKSKDEKETTGVGLAITKKLMSDIGQRIWIDSQFENGTAFCLTLPVSD